MSSATNDTVTVTFDPTATSKQADIIGPASPTKAGAMSAQQAQQLLELLPATGKIVLENLNTYVDAVNGNDANDGKTPATALKTIIEAFKRQPIAWFKDNIIWLLPGSYSLDDFPDVFDARFGSFQGDTGSPLAIIAVDPEEFLAAGPITSATTFSITNAAAAWGVNAFQGMMIETLTGTGAGQRASIRSNTSTDLFLQRELDPAPDATTTFRIIGASGRTELVGNFIAAVFPFTLGGIGFRDLQFRMVDGEVFFMDFITTDVPAMSGCKILLGSANFIIRYDAIVSFGTGLGAQWFNSDQGVPLFPGEWDCSTFIVGGEGNGLNWDTGAKVLGSLMTSGAVMNIGNNSFFNPFPSLFGINTTLNGKDGATIKIESTSNVPTVLDGQETADATTGILNLRSGARLSLDGDIQIKNSAGHGVLADTTSYINTEGGVLSGAGNVGLGMSLDRGAQLDVAVATLPTIIGGGGELQVGTLAPQAWATLSAPASFVDTAVLCRATSR